MGSFESLNTRNSEGKFFFFVKGLYMMRQFGNLTLVLSSSLTNCSPVGRSSHCIGEPVASYASMAKLSCCCDVRCDSNITIPHWEGAPNDHRV